MYFLEFIIKKLTNNKLENMPLQNDTEQDYEDCEHVFMPIDSTNVVLSCSKCGLIVKQSDLKSKNIFTHN